MRNLDALAPPRDVRELAAGQDLGDVRSPGHLNSDDTYKVENHYSKDFQAIDFTFRQVQELFVLDES